VSPPERRIRALVNFVWAIRQGCPEDCDSRVWSRQLTALAKTYLQAEAAAQRAKQL